MGFFQGSFTRPTIYCTYLGCLFEITVKETKITPARPCGMTSAEGMSLFDIMQLFDLFISQINDIEVRYKGGWQSQFRVLEDKKDILQRIRSLVTDFGTTVSVRTLVVNIY
jgi:hypothetical protein